MKINKTSPLEQNYLQILGGIAKSPKSLYFIGKLPERRIPSVAIVGTRRPSRYGQEVTHTLSYELAKRGIVIISGLALGVDAIAHKAALEAGGTTLAVLANGLPKICPATNRDIAHKIIEQGGAIISERGDNEDPRNYDFLIRNRIVSGLSDAIIITEAAARSGTLNTASHALEQGRDVFVAPGNITSPLSAGCNTLIKQGATPITCAEDVLDIIAPQTESNQSLLPLGDTPQETAILALIQNGYRDGEELQRKSEIPVHEFSVALTMLEMNGSIRNLGANQWTLK